MAFKGQIRYSSPTFPKNGRISDVFHALSLSFTNGLIVWLIDPVIDRFPARPTELLKMPSAVAKKAGSSLWLKERKRFWVGETVRLALVELDGERLGESVVLKSWSAEASTHGSPSDGEDGKPYPKE